MSVFVKSEVDVKKDVEPPDELAAEIRKSAAELENFVSLDIIKWSVDRFGDDLVVATSFQDLVLVDLAVQVKPSIRFIFLDTGYHFPETLSYMEQSREKFNMNLEITHPFVGLDEHPCGAADCCQYRKVEPLNKALSGVAAWITGVKRVDTPEREGAPVVMWDNKGLVKINPMVAWTDADVDNYVTQHHLAPHPLVEKGYVSIGCAPTTRPVAIGENPRNGRWADSEKTECGLHI